MTSIRIDASELNALAVDLEAAGAAASLHARKQVAEHAYRIKDTARALVTGLRHAPAYPLSIGYDLHETPEGVAAEIGPDKDKRQGALGNLLEYGSVKNPPFAHLGPALDLDEPLFISGMAQPFEKLA